MQSTKPLVSVCTPTFNRRPFIPAIIKCFLAQDYPAERMEWIILDDGTDKIGDLVKDVPGVKYTALPAKLALGAKRNAMHALCKGDIIVYMDDDDYYPPQRVSHAVNMLMEHPNVQCAGSSVMHIYYKDLNKMYRFGPYGVNHATAATFAFRRSFLRKHKYKPEAAIAEEKAFLNNFSEPMVQLDTKKTILVFSHAHNTFDKRRLLENMNPTYVNESPLRVGDFIQDKVLRTFYTKDIDPLLQEYAPGRPDLKTDVIEQMAQMELERQHAAAAGTAHVGITVKTPDGGQHTLTPPQIVDLLSKQHAKIIELQELVEAQKKEMLEMALSRNIPYPLVRTA